MHYDIIIIGAGPGGIFSAYELMQLDPSLKVAVFEAGGRRKSMDIQANTARVPWELLEEGLLLKVGVCGSEGRQLIPTEMAEADYVCAGANPAGDPGAAATPELWLQVLTRSVQAVNAAQAAAASAAKVVDAYEAGELNGAPGPQGPQGTPGESPEMGDIVAAVLDALPDGDEVAY